MCGRGTPSLAARRPGCGVLPPTPTPPPLLSAAKVDENIPPRHRRSSQHATVPTQLETESPEYQHQACVPRRRSRNRTDEKRERETAATSGKKKRRQLQRWTKSWQLQTLYTSSTHYSTRHARVTKRRQAYSDTATTTAARTATRKGTNASVRPLGFSSLFYDEVSRKKKLRG